MDIIKVTQLNRDHINYLVDNLEDFEKDKAIRKGLSRGGNVLKQGGVRRLKMTMKSPMGVTGNLIRAFSVRVKKNKLGVLSGFGYPEGRHSWLVDQGTNWRHTKKGYKSRGYGRALRYWQDTKDKDGPKAILETEKGIERAVQRINERRA